MHSVICSIYLTPHCYQKGFTVEMGLKKQKQLIPGAVPTVQSPAANNSDMFAKITLARANEEAADKRCSEISYTEKQRITNLYHLIL